MRFAHALALGAAAVCLTGCITSGPRLPPNVGTNHRNEAEPGARAEHAEREAIENMETGTPVWSDFRGTGFFFYGTVVEHRGELHRVVYIDGGNEWVEASALQPDRLSVDARVHVRPTIDGQFSSATITRRLGHALYVNVGGGQERWTALPQVRFEEGQERPAEIEAASESDESSSAGTATGVEPGALVLAEYRNQGLRFAGTVTARRDDGSLHVVYLDGESEWVGATSVVSDNLTEGDVVQVRRQWDPPEWTRGVVRERVGDALRVEFDDGGTTWTSMFRIRTLAIGG